MDFVPLPDRAAALGAHARREDAYPVHVVDSAARAIELLLEELDGASVALITDETVEALYAGEIVAALREAGIDVLASSVPAGEASKDLSRAVELWDWLARSSIGRRDVVVNLGGGVVCDLGGWVASAYMRGLPYINVPTTLLAQVDGALGGKTAVNHPLAKNLLGAFHQPAAVISNVGYLSTTSRRHLAAGAGRGGQEGDDRLARVLGAARGDRRATDGRRRRRAAGARARGERDQVRARARATRTSATCAGR